MALRAFDHLTFHVRIPACVCTHRVRHVLGWVRDAHRSDADGAHAFHVFDYISDVLIYARMLIVCVRSARMNKHN